MADRQLALEPLTLPDVDALQLVRIAADTGFSHVGMVLNAPVPQMPADLSLRDRQRRGEVLQAMSETGVRLCTVECFNLTPEADRGDFEQALDCASEYHALSATAIVWENPDRAGALETLRWLCDAAAERDIVVNLEFFASCRTLGTLGAAIDLVRDAGRKNALITIDLLHVMRTGSSIAEIRALPAELIGGAQVSDGLLVADESELLAEAGGSRMVPGDGEFPIREFIDALPPEIVLGVEVPQVAMIGRTSPEARAETLASAMRNILSSGVG
jgi:sugar phosphate isomerase/epimerase